ncbi:MAG TPA: hypothetical protein VLI05_04560 [Candidatus Saccharimonadia bacterium]|nr:hypothetical protein [Candidatus Saccharimonadia bacterium]
MPALTQHEPVLAHFQGYPLAGLAISAMVLLALHGALIWHLIATWPYPWRGIASVVWTLSLLIFVVGWLWLTAYPQELNTYSSLARLVLMLLVFESPLYAAAMCWDFSPSEQRRRQPRD